MVYFGYPFGTIGRVVGLVVGTAWLVKVFHTRDIRFHWLFAPAILLFLLWSAISITWSADPQLALSDVSRYVLLVGMAIVLIDIFDSYFRIRWGLQAFVLGASVGIAFLLVEFFAMGGLQGDIRRLTVPGYNANRLGGLLAIALPMAVYLFFDQPKTAIRALNGLFIPVAIFAVFLTGSRQAMVALVPTILLLVYLVLSGRGSVVQLLVTALSAGLVVILPFMLPERLAERILTMPEEILSGNLGGRRETMAQAAPIISEHFFLGVGAGNHPISPHNTFLRVFIQFGVIGEVLFVTILAIVLVAAYHIERGRAMWLTMLAVWVTLSMTNHWNVHATTWLIFGLIVAAYSITNQTSYVLANRRIRTTVLGHVESHWRRRLDRSPIRFAAFALFIGLAFTIPLRDLVVFDFGTIAQPVGAFAVAGWFGAILAEREVRALKAFHVLLGGFLLFAMASLAWAIESSLARGELVRYLMFAMIILLAWDLCRTQKQLLIAIQAFVLGGAVTAVATVHNFLIDLRFVGSSGEPLSGRYTAGAFWPNTLAGIFVICLLLSCYLILHRDAFGRNAGLVAALNLAFIPLAMVGILLTGSRQGLVAMAIGLPIVLLLLVSEVYRTGLNRPMKFTIATGVCVIPAALVYWLWTYEMINVDRFLTIPDEVFGGDLNNRVLLWEASIQAIQERPLFGYGIGTAKEAIAPFRPEHIAAGREGRLHSPHNSFLTVAVELGLIGFAFLAAVLGNAIASAMRFSAAVDRIYWLTVLGILFIISFVETRINDPLFWFTLAFLVGAANIQLEKTLSLHPSDLRRRVLHVGGSTSRMDEDARS